MLLLLHGIAKSGKQIVKAFLPSETTRDGRMLRDPDVQYGHHYQRQQKGHRFELQDNG